MKKKICIVIADYYPDISKMLLKGALETLEKTTSNKFKNYFDQIYVPGIFEIPVTIAKKIEEFDAFVALGCVIKGKTPHFNLISKSVINSIMDISIKNRKPIGNGILVCLNKKQAFERAKNNEKNKGREAARAVLATLSNF